MKTSLIASAGLVLGVLLSLPALGCKITHYGTPGTAADPSGEIRCLATCERLVDEGAIPRSSAKSCLAACKSPAALAAAKADDARVADASEAASKASAAKASDAKARDRACPSFEDSGPQVVVVTRRDAPCPCKKGHDCVPCRGSAPAAPAAIACEGDSDCPEDKVCDGGVCQ